MLPEEKSKAQILYRWFDEVWSLGRLETIDELMHQNCVSYGAAGPGSDLPGPDAFKPFVRNFRLAFPDLQIKVMEAAVHGDLVTTRWTARGTHTGNGIGIPATGHPVHLEGLSMAIVRGGQIVRAWNSWNADAMVQQLRSATSVLKVV